ncbi:unnamed protein product [Orchesella dallaii]|uniref:CRAL-TRIO domain-containing protein n=1 Tax=Orchesella dallaii TaxID=48710 RepID=A0ABP1PWD7_9HEXA
MKVYHILTQYFWTIIFVLHWNLITPQSDSKDLLLTVEEKATLDEFKSQVIPILPEDYMKSDFYLVRWLRARAFDIPAAKTMLLDTMKWRKANRIKSIMKENWSDMAIDFPVTFGSFDKVGRPVVTLEMGDWDFQAAVVTGKAQILNRYLTYIIERYVQSVFKAQAAGKNVTRVVTLVDVEGFNLRKHSCPQCISIMVRWTATTESYYPQFVKDTVIINAPTLIQVPLNAVKPFMGRETREQLHVFGTNKEQWMSFLDERIDRNQRTARYGGTKLKVE